MHGVLSPPRLYTAEEYLAAERVAEERHEYLAGAIYAMAGTSVMHGRILQNIQRHLGNQLVGKPCELFSTEIKVRVRKNGAEFFYYPDIIVDCGHAPDSSLFADKPRVIFEILSRETERIDRGEKFANYQSFSSLDTYVLVDQYQIALTIHRRMNDGWSMEFLNQKDDTLSLPSIDCALPLTSIYERTDLLR